VYFHILLFKDSILGVIKMAPETASKFTFVFVAIGQGDCCLVRCPDGRIIVIDCGTANDSWKDERYPLWFQLAKNLLRDWAGNNKNNVDALILTHHDRDHYNKVIKLFNNDTSNKIDISIDNIYFSDACYDKNKSPLSKYRANSFNNAIINNNVQTTNLYEVTINDEDAKLKHWKTKELEKPYKAIESAIINNKYKIVSEKEDGTGWSVSIIAGNVPDGSKGCPEDINSRSLITLFEIGEKKALFCGDATFSTEKFLLKNHRSLLKDIEFIKVAHHGSENASKQEFVDLINPKGGVVSVGLFENSYCLPRYDKVLTRWLDKLDKSAAKIGDHDIDYWVTKKDEGCEKDIETKEIEEDEEKEENIDYEKIWEDNSKDASKIMSFLNITYLKAPDSNTVIAARPFTKKMYYLWRESTDLNLTETSQGTQVYYLSTDGIEYKKIDYNDEMANYKKKLGLVLDVKNKKKRKREDYEISEDDDKVENGENDGIAQKKTVR
jgi:beta-lactamase superfamily II metal-dependent hydrolase